MRYPLTGRAIVSGIFLGVIFSFIGIYLILKIGILALGGVFLLGYLILSITGGYDAKENAIILTIVGATTLASTGFIDPIAAEIIYSQYATTEIHLTIPSLLSITLPGALLGIFVLYPFYKEFIQLRWPMVTPMAYMVKVLEKTGSEELKQAIRGLVFSSITSTSLMLTNTYQIDFVKGRNRYARLSFTGITISPLYASIGFFISWLGYLFLIIGVLYSMFIWIFVEKANPYIGLQEHFFNPYIYSVAIPMMITTAILTLITYGKKIKESIKNIQEESGRAIILSIISLILLPGVVGLSFLINNAIPIGKLIEILKIIIIALPIIFISAIFAVRAAGETGFSTSITLDATLIITLFLISPSFESLLISFAIISVFESMAISFIRRVKFCSIIGVDVRDVIKAVIIGGLVGAISGPTVFYIFHTFQGGIGSDFWPAPTAKLLGGYVLFFYIGIKERRLPPMIDVRLLIISVILTIIIWEIFQKKGLRGLSPILIAMGIIIPPSFLWIASIGAFIDYWLVRKYGADKSLYARERSKWNALLSGVMSGEGLVLFAFTMIAVIPMILALL
ncbi:MAG: OPT/YSL family transporter [Candidatus Njordarchaeales archaeon]